MKMNISKIKKIIRQDREVTVSEGVVARKGGLQLSFTYNGQRRKETLRLDITKPNLRHAIETRGAIVREIELTGTFKYHRYFPQGKNGARYGIIDSKKTVQDALEEYLAKKKEQIEFSTWDDYRKDIRNQIIPHIGDIRLQDLKPLQLQTWLDKQTCSKKRTDNILIPLREVLDNAVITEQIIKNPLNHIVVRDNRSNQEIDITTIDTMDEETEETNINPFTLHEMHSIISGAQDTPHFGNLIEFAFWTGMRTSELIGLRWCNVDLDNDEIRVKIAKVRGRYKRPKSKAGNRKIKLLPPAKEALLRQYQLTGEANEAVFHNPRHNQEWQGDKPIRESYWRPLLNKLGITYRKPYQTRHTYASMMLSSGVNPLWVADQMGHEDWAMIRKHYGRWIEDYEKDAGKHAVQAWENFKRQQR